MSYIDERVVEMQFNNKDFEKNVATSLNTLDKLQAALKLDGSQKGLEELQKTSNHFNMSPLLNAVENVNDKFSALNIIGTTALVNITNRAINAGEALIKSLSVDNISAGWDKFGEKTTSVATLVAQGYDLSTVEDQMRRLNWFTDETSYNFTDMVSNISKFTASGQELEPSVTAMMGIANWAALSGQNATTASRAMYQLSQAMGKGVLKYDDWKSIQNASMDTTEFRNKAIETAIALGKVKKVGEDAYAIIGAKKAQKFSLAEMFTSDALSKQQWFTDDVMMGTFKRYSAAVDEIYKYTEEHDVIASQAMDELGDSVDGFGLKAFQAAQQARTFRDVIDATKDAVSTGWMNTFEYIFGNYEEATELWSGLAEVFYDVFAAGGETRNAMLKLWKEMGGRDILLKAISVGFQDILRFVEPLNKVLEEFIPSDPEKRAKALYGATQKLLEVMRNLSLTTRSSNELTDAFRGVFSFIGLIVDGFRTLGYVLEPLLDPLNVLAGYFLQLLGAIGRSITGFRNFTKSSGEIAGAVEIARAVVEKFANFVTKAIIVTVSFIKHLTKFVNINKIFKTFNSLIKNMATRVAPYFNKVSQVVDKVVEKFRSLFSLTDIRSGFSAAISAISDKFSAFGNIASSAFNKVLPYLISAKNKVLEFFSSFQSGTSKLQNVDIIGNIGNVVTKVGEKLAIARDAVANFVNMLREAESPLDAVHKVIDKVREKIESFSKTISDFIKNSGLDELKDKFIESFNAVINKIRELGASRVLMFMFGVAITTMMLEIGNAAAKAAEMFSTITTIPKLISTTVTKIGRLAATNSILQVAEAIGILALSLKLLSTIDSKDLKDSAAALLLLSAAMAVIAVVMSKFGSDSGFATNAFGIVALAGSVMLLAVSLALLEKIEFKHLVDSMKVLGAFALGLVAASRLLGAASKTTLPQVAMLLAFAFSIEKVVNAFVKIENEMKPEVIDKVLSTMLTLMAGLATIAFFAGGLSAGSALALIAIAMSLDLMYGMMKKIANSDVGMELIMQNLEKFEAVFIFLAGLFATTMLAGEHALGAAATILALGISMSLLVGVLERIDALGYRLASSHWKATLWTFGIMMSTLLAAIVLSAAAGPNAIKAAVAIVAITGCMYLMIGILEQLDKLTFAMTKAGTYERTVATLGGLMLALGGLMALSALTHFAKPSAILSIMAAVGILIAGMAILSDASLDQDRMLKVAKGMGIVLVALGVCFALTAAMSRVAKTGPIMATVGAMLVLFGSLIVLTDMSNQLKDPSQMLYVAGAMAGVLVAFGVLMLLMAGAAKIAKGAIVGAAAILVVSLSLIPVAASIAVLAFTFNNVSIDAAVGAVGSLILMMFAMAGAAVVANAAIVGAAAMGVMALSLVGVAFAISLIAAIPTDQLVNAGIALGAVIGVFAILAGISVASGGVFAAGMMAVAYALQQLALALLGIGAAAVLFAAAVDIIVENLLTLGNLTDEETNRIGENVIKIMGDIGTGLGEAIKNLIKSLFNGLKELFNGIKTRFAEQRESMKASAKSLFDRVVEAIRETAGEAWNTMVDFIKGIIDPIVKSATDFYNGAKNAVTQYVSGITGSLAAGYRAAKDFIDKVVEGIKSGVKKFYDAAKNCVQGFINGIRDFASGAVDAVVTFGGDIIGAFRGEMKENSPSKVFMDSGYYCVAGFKEGIEKNSSLAEKSMTKLASDSLEAFNDRMGIHSESDEMIESGGYTVEGFTNRIMNDPRTKGAAEFMADTFTGQFDKSMAGKGASAVGNFASEVADAAKNSDFNLMEMWNSLDIGDAPRAVERRRKTKEEVHAETQERLNKIYAKQGKLQKENTDNTKDYSSALGTATGATNGLSGAGAGLSDTTAEAAKQVDTLTNIMDYASEAVGIFNNHWALGIDNLSNTQAFNASKDALELLALQLYETSIASETAEEAAERMGKSQVEIMADIKQAYLDTRDGIAETLRGQIDLFKMADFGEKKKGGELIEMARSQKRLKTTFEQSFETLSEIAAGLDGAEELLKHFADEGMTSMGDLSSVLDMSAEELKEFAGYAKEFYGSNTTAYTDMANRMMSDMAYVGYKSAGGFAEGLSPEEGAAIGDKFGHAALEAMRAKFGVNLQSGEVPTKELGEAVAKSFNEGLTSEESDKAVESAENVSVSVVEALGDTVNHDTGKEVGIDFCEGIVVGIENGSGPVYEAVGTLGDGMKDTLMTRIEAHSPSKVAERAGRYFDMGLVGGLLEYSGRVRDAVAETALGATDELNNIFNRIGDLIDGTIDLDPTIRPVLDLTNLQYGATQIGSLLGLNDPYALNAVAGITGIQNDASLMASLTGSLTDAINGMKKDQETPQVTINIYPQEGQSAEEIAEEVSWRLNHDVFKRRAVYGGT